MAVGFEDRTMRPSEQPPRSDYSTARLTQRYRFDDPNMDLFFLGALGWGPAGGLSAGEAFHVASHITDGDPDSWVRAFEEQGRILADRADSFVQQGSLLAAGESRLKAFACYRSGWQFASPGNDFASMFRTSQALFDRSMAELNLPSTAFTIAWGGSHLPGHFFRAPDRTAPTILVIGGADTCHEDRFLSQGKYYLDRGYSVALVDLPGQGLTMEDGLSWEPEVERPIGAVIDHLIANFGVSTDKLALLGMSLGGYFACRAAAQEPRIAAVIASSPLSRPVELFEATLATVEKAGNSMSRVARRNLDILLWKGGVADGEALVSKWANVFADPAKVHKPFLSCLGGQEGSVWKTQTLDWHHAIRPRCGSLIYFSDQTGADAHCQGNNPLLLAQKVDIWLRTVFSGA